MFNCSLDISFGFLPTSQRDEWRCEVSTICDETAVEVDQANEESKPAFGSMDWYSVTVLTWQGCTP